MKRETVKRLNPYASGGCGPNDAAMARDALATDAENKRLRKVLRLIAKPGRCWESCSAEGEARAALKPRKAP